MTTATIFTLYHSPEAGQPRYGVRFGSDPLPTEEEILIVGLLEGGSTASECREILVPGYIQPAEKPSWETALGVARERTTGHEHREPREGLLDYPDR